MNSEAPQNVQCTSEVMNGIGSNRTPPNGRTSVLDADTVGTAPRFLFWLNDDSVRVGLDEGFLGRVQIEDVLFGPFDLDAAAGIPGAAA